MSNFGIPASLWTVIGIAVFGMFGTLTRYGLDLWVTRAFASVLPLGTFVVNMAGSLLIGIVYEILVVRALFPSEWRLPIMVGFLGAFTTFSSYLLEAVRLGSGAYIWTAVGYLILSPLAGLGAVVLGVWLARGFFS